MKTISRNDHVYIIINASYEGIWVEFEKKDNTTLVFPTFKLPSGTDNIL